MTIKEIREMSGLNRTAFARAYAIPYRTVENWERGDSQCPRYMLNLLERAVREDSAEVSLKCYDDNILRELGSVYNDLLHVMNKEGHNPFPDADIFPWRYFMMVHSRAVSLHIPDDLHERITLLLGAIDMDDFDKAMTTPCPMGKRMCFISGMMGIR